jgi:carboxylesterase
MKRFIKILLSIFLIITALFLINYIINETTFLYSEPQEYPKDYPVDQKELIKKLISENRLMHEDASPIIQQKKGNDTAILFIHGFTGNAVFFKYYSEKAIEDGYDVINTLLPGLGTSTNDYKKAYFSQWYNYAKDVYKYYRKNYKNFFVVGLSMGGAITLKLAEEFSDDPEYPVTGVATISAPVFLNSLIEHGAVSHWIFWFARTFSFFTDEMERKNKMVNEDGVDRRIAYDGVFFKQLHSFKINIKPIKRNLDKITCPILLSQSKGDEKVPYQNLHYIANNIGSDEIKIKEYDLRKYTHEKHDLCIYDSTRDDLYSEIIRFIEEYSK